MLPAIGQELHLPYSNREGWLSGIFEKVCGKEVPFVLGICFPLDRQLKLTIQGVECYSFVEDLNTPEKYVPELETTFEKIFEDFKPDIIHVFGTEFPHTLAAVKAFHNPHNCLPHNRKDLRFLL